MKNKTTIAGILTIIAALAKLIADIANGNPVDIAGLLTGVVAGTGLIAAKDSNVTGGTVSVPTVPNPPVLKEDKK